LMTTLSLGIATYAVVGYGVLRMGVPGGEGQLPSISASPIGIHGHIAAAAIALALGPFQFSTRLRRSFQNVHRWSGRVYLVCVLVGGLFGLYVSQFAAGGVVARSGFAALAICWLYSAARAFFAIRHGAIQKHRKWMVRNFALTFAAVTLRIYLPLSGAAGIEFATAYPIIAWLCWVPNLLIAEWVFNTATGTVRRRAPAGRTNE